MGKQLISQLKRGLVLPLLHQETGEKDLILKKIYSVLFFLSFVNHMERKRLRLGNLKYCHCFCIFPS